MAYRLEKYLDNTNKPICQQVVHYYDFCQYELNFTQETMNGKVNSINHFLRYSKVEEIHDITTEVVLEYIKYQTAQGLKPRTINNRTKHILAMMKFYINVEDYEFPNFKINKIKKQKEAPSDKRAFDRKTIVDVLAVADREAWLLIKIAFDCGLRISELRGMRLRDLNGNMLTVHGKGRKTRFVILSDEVVLRLQDWIKRKHVTDYFWESVSRAHKGQPKSSAAIRLAMRKPFTECGIHQMCPHELRHSYASDLLDLGASVRSIQQGLGHSSTKITEIYLHELEPGKATRELYELKYSSSLDALR